MQRLVDAGVAFRRDVGEVVPSLTPDLDDIISELRIRLGDLVDGCTISLPWDSRRKPPKPRG